MELQNIKISEAYESPTNPRGKNFEGKAFDELIASIKEKGVLVPVIARYGKTGHKLYEIVAGNRRFRAAKKAGLEEIPARIEMMMSDEEAQEVQIIENLQRENVHPLDEAEAYFRLVKTTDDIKVTAAKVGKSDTYVRNRIMLNNLAEDLKTAYRQGSLNDGQAFEISRLSPEGDQQKALKKVTDHQQWGKTMSVSDLKEWIEHTFFDELSFQPWLKSKEAMEAVGECQECPKDTNTLFGETKQGACTTSKCHARKMNRYITWMKKQNPELVLVSSEWRAKKGVLSNDDYRKASKTDKGAKQALIVTGKNKGRIIYVTVIRMPEPAITPEGKKKQEEKAEKDRIAKRKREAEKEAKQNRKLEAALNNITWPLEERYLKILLDIVLSSSQDEQRIAKRLKLEGELDEDGDYKDTEKALREYFDKSEPTEKIRLIFEIAVVGDWKEDEKIKELNSFKEKGV